MQVSVSVMNGGWINWNPQSILNDGTENVTEESGECFTVTVL